MANNSYLATTLLILSLEVKNHISKVFNSRYTEFIGTSQYFLILGSDGYLYRVNMASFRKNQTLNKFQTLIGEIYALTDDRTYSLWDLLTQQQRFTMRALKGIRKGNKKKLIKNLMISLSWLMAIANRFHIKIEDEV